MMHLFLLRHADAEPNAGSDEARRLTEKGREQAKKVGRFMDAHELQLSLVLTSPVRRAHETAQIVVDQMRSELIIAPWLACGMHPEAAVQELEAYRSQTSVMLVGHEPDFSQLCAHLLALPSATQIHVRKASLSLFNLPVLRGGAATLEFSIPCKLM
jgi:phosphohistidine phosphatase